jgi:hypothetical protein
VHEKSQLVEMRAPRHVGYRGLRLRASGVEHHYIDRAGCGRYRVHELSDLRFIGDVSREAAGETTALSDRCYHLGDPGITRQTVDGYR